MLLNTSVTLLALVYAAATNAAFKLLSCTSQAVSPLAYAALDGSDDGGGIAQLSSGPATKNSNAHAVPLPPDRICSDLRACRSAVAAAATWPVAVAGELADALQLEGATSSYSSPNHATVPEPGRGSISKLCQADGRSGQVQVVALEAVTVRHEDELRTDSSRAFAMMLGIPKRQPCLRENTGKGLQRDEKRADGREEREEGENHRTMLWNFKTQKRGGSVEDTKERCQWKWSKTRQAAAKQMSKVLVLTAHQHWTRKDSLLPLVHRENKSELACPERDQQWCRWRRWR